MKKFLIGLLASVFMTANIGIAQNLGFEDGTTTGWTSSTLSAVGSTTTQAGSNTWVINPYGSYMGQLQIQSGSFNQMTSALGLTGASSTGITTLLQQQAQTGGGNPTPTTAGWVTREVTLTAGQTFTLAWQYVSVDYVPFNDGSIATLTQNGTDVATVNNYNQQYALLGFTNPGTGDYSTGSYGATGWQVATFQVSVSGTYTLGFGVFNLGDTALSPVLYIDEVQGTTTLNGQTFGAVAPNNSTAPTSPVSGGGGSGGGTPSPISTVNNTTVDTSNLASSVTVNGGTIQIASNNITLTNTFTTDTNGMTIDQNGNTVDFSGVISGSGGVTIANTGTGGGVTFSAVNTYTGTTTINSGAGLQNTGTIAGDVTNLGTFLNTGTAGNVTNGFNGDGNTASLVNSGTVGNVTNFSTFANSGTTGTVNNFGTFNNTGSTGTFNNAGVLNNTVGGVVNELGYNNHWVQNSGTINNITYNGGTVINNPDGVIGTINNSEAHGSFHNDGTVTGNVTTNSTFNNNATGVVQGLYTNNGTLNNAGTVGAVTNNGTFNNTGTAGTVTLVSGTFTNTGTAASVDNTAGLTFTNGGTITGQLTNAGTVTNDGNIGSVNNTGTFTNNGTTGDWTNSGTMTNAGTMGNGTNSGTYTNTGSVGNVTNTGTLTTSGSAGVITNSGTVTMTDGTASINNTGSFTISGGTLGAYTQTAPGTTTMSANTPVTVTNTASLGGGLTVNDAPIAYGRYTVLSAGSVTGTYNSFTSAGVNDYLKYSATGVKLYVTPPAGATQSSINAVANNTASALNIQAGALNGILGNDCNLFGDNGGCVSTSIGSVRSAGGDLTSGNLIVAKKINANWRAGLFLNQQFNNPTYGSVKLDQSGPAVGGFAAWTKDRFELQASVAGVNNKLNITRNGPEVGQATATSNGTAYQLKGSYSIPVTEKTTVTPYAGIRYTQLNVGGYTEQGPVFPLTVNSTKQTTTDALAGVGVSHKITDRLTGSVSAGLIKNINYQTGTVAGTSEIGGLSSFNAGLPGSGYTSVAVGTGLSYAVAKNQRIGVNLGWQQKSLINSSIASYGVSYTVGF